MTVPIGTAAIIGRFYLAQGSWFDPEFRTPPMLPLFAIDLGNVAALAI